MEIYSETNQVDLRIDKRNLVNMNWTEPTDFVINNYELKLTCWACPEQYDVFNINNGKQVGYLRLRHGSFSVTVPECSGNVVYHANPKGDGVFDDEREFYLKEAIKAIENQDEQTAFDMVAEREDI